MNTTSIQVGSIITITKGTTIQVTKIQCGFPVTKTMKARKNYRAIVQAIHESPESKRIEIRSIKQETILVAYELVQPHFFLDRTSWL